MKYKIRNVRETDRKKIEEISSYVWDGNDYLPKVFDDWVRDTEWPFFAVEVDGTLAGVAKIEKFSDDCGWCEGLRMAKEFRGMGLAHILTDEMIKTAKKKGLSSLRLSTHIRNHESIHIIEKYGFIKYSERRILRREVPEGVISDAFNDVFRVRSYNELPEQFMSTDNTRIWDEMISFGWVFKPLSQNELELLIKDGAVYRSQDSVAVYTSDSERPHFMNIGWMTGGDVMPLILKSLEIAASTGKTTITCMTPPKSAFESALRLCGFKAYDENDPPELLLYKMCL